MTQTKPELVPVASPLPSMVRNLNAEFVPAKWDGVDTSGIRVIGKCVLVLVDECSPVTSGGIHLTPDAIEKLSAGCETGTLVRVSPGAFLLNEDMTAWTGEKPKPGDRVYIEKYAGKLVRGQGWQNLSSDGLWLHRSDL
jgi:chaperonin GroES